MMTHAITAVKKFNKLSVIVIIMFAVLITACSSAKTSTVKTNSNDKTFKTSSDATKVWHACIDSLSDIRFRANSTKSTEGLIIADEAVAGKKDSVSQLSIRIFREAGNTNVAIKYVASPDAAGSGETMDKFVEVLKRRLPDLKPVVMNN